MAAPELRLEVSLNLAGFRNEVRKLTQIAQSEFVPKINVKFNRQTLDAELNNLQRAIKRRVYRVEIGGNIDSLPGKIKALKEQLSSLESFKIDLGIGAVKSLSKKDASKIKSDLRAEILGEQKKLYIPTSIQAKISRDDVRNFKNAVKSKLTGLSVDVKVNAKGGGFAGSEQGAAGLMQYMRSQGMVGKTASGMEMRLSKGGDDIKQQLSDAVQSAEKIKSVFDGVAKNIATTGKSIANVQGKRLSLANVPLIAGSVEKKVERSAEAIGGTMSPDVLKVLYPEINKTIASFASLKGQIQQNTSKLSGFSLIIGLAAFAGVPLAKSIVKLTGSTDNFAKLLDKLGPKLEAAFAKATSSILNSASSRLLSGGRPVGLLPAAYRGIGPSAEPAGLLPPAYRGIGPSRNAGSLPGTAFGRQKYLPTALGEELKEVLRGAANAFLDSIRRNIRAVTVADIGPTLSRQGLLRGGSVAGYLPPVARFGEGRTASPYSTGRLGREGETRAELFARREREARMRSALRGVDVMGAAPSRAPAPYSQSYRASPSSVSAIVPYAAGGAIVPSGGGGGGGTGGTGGGPGNFARRGGGGGGGFNVPQLPGSGVVRELGEEFGFATKQVLLFGTAYKALAFLQGFPAQVGNAVSALQSFRNTLNAISPTAVDAAASNQLIIDTVDKYNIPIQSARNGFTKLYASMKPAGFSGEQIGNLFLGISKASATLGLSSDKVDRVTYAFSQMASKGQLMAEEVTGQLGDVIPGALSIMAEAANMDIKTFKKAMEDGMFTGKAFEAVMSNVPIVMEKRFGKGAEGAAKTFQGALNDMQTSLTLLYEAFEPVAVGFLNTVVKPMTDGLQTITDGFNAFFTGQAAQTAGGNAFAKQLTDLKPAFDGILVNINALIPSFQIFGGLLLNVAKFLATLAGNPITGFLLKVYTNVLLVNTAFNLLGGKILLGLIANINAAIFRLVAFGYAINAVGIQTTGANTALAGTQLQMLLLQRNVAGATGPVNALLGSLLRLAGIGVIAIGITIAINNANELREAEERVARLRGEKDPVGPAGPKPVLTAARSFTGASRETVQKAREAQAPLLLQYRNELKALQAQLLTAQAIANASEDNAQAAAANVKLRTAQARVDAKQIDIQKAQAILNLSPQQYKTEAERQRASVGTLATITGGGAGTGKPPKEQSLESYYSLQDQLAKAQTQADIDRLEAAFEHARALVNAEYDLKEAKANSFQKKAIAFQKEIFAITSEQDAALFKNRNKVLAAAGSVTGGAGGGTGGSLTGMTQYITGDPSHPSYKPDHGTIANYHDHLAFASREAAIEAYNKLTKSGIQVTEFQGFGRGVTGPHSGPRSAHHKGLAMDVPGAQWGGSGAIGTREFAGSARVRAILGMGGGAGAAFGKVTGDVKRDKLAEQQVALAAREANAANIEKEAEATAKLQIATANYVQSLVPTAEQALQNQLLQQRITLTQNSFSPEILEAQLAFAEQELQVTENIRRNTEEINRLTTVGGNNAKQINALTDANNQLKANLPVSAIQLYSKSINEQVLLLAQRNDAAKKDAADQERISDLIIGGMSRQAAEAKVTADNLKNNYKKALEEATRQVDIAAAAEEAFAITKRMSGTLTEAQTAQYNALADALKKAREEREKLEGMAPAVASTATGIESIGAPKTAKGYIADAKDETQQELDQLTNWGYQVAEGGKAIGNAFGQAFRDIVSGSISAREALANMMQSIADHFLDMAAQIIAKQITMIIYGTIMKVLGVTAGASGAGGGLSSGFDAGGASALPTDAGGWSQSFATPLKFANGGIAAGGFTAFASGGMVTGPTMGLVGEGKYNEAIVPLPDGKSIPVQMTGASGSSSLRDAMNNNSVANSSPILNMSFQSTNINGVEYVSRDQLESAMAETRRNATRDGAKRGMTMTLDRIQNSSSIRRKVGI